MIKLTLTPQTQPISYLFEKNKIAIGRALPQSSTLLSNNGTASNTKTSKNLGNNCKPSTLETAKTNSIAQPDLPLPLEALLPEHVVIEEIEGQFLVTNVANDPYTTLNGNPFYKKFLSNGDLLLIDSIAIRFEGTSVKATSQQAPNIPNIDYLLRRVEELKIALIEAGATPAPSTPQKVNFSNETQAPFAPVSQDENRSQPTKEIRKSLKDDYLRDLDDENESDSSLKAANPRFVIGWTTLFTFLIGFLFFCGAAFAIFYISMTDRSEKEEIKVAAAVADIVMALNFAQINHGMPQNQNWSDPDFLKHNLNAVLGNGYQPIANIDSHGQFIGTSYILRIYTSSKQDHFLVIAQPNANLLQWLVPKSAIIVDSKLMELRKTNDLKTLNRLLIDPTLDHNNSGDIGFLVGQGSLITFEEINRTQKDESFITPKALAFIYPGAENLIYNALRYYRFGESLIKKGISLYESRDTQHDISQMLQEIDAFTKLKNIVLYTSGGLKSAEAMQKAIGQFAPQHKFVFGYVQVNPKGVAHSGHLLIDDSSTTVAALSPSEIAKPHNRAHPLHVYEDSTGFHYVANKNALDDLLPTIFHEREEAVGKIDGDILDLIKRENDSPISDFTDQLAQLFHQHEIIDLKYQIKITNALGLLLTASLNESHKEIEDLADEDPEDELDDDSEGNLTSSSKKQDGFSKNKLALQLENIRSTDSLTALNQAIHQITTSLSSGHLPRTDLLVAFQNAVHTEVVLKLDHLILSPNENDEELQDKNRPLLENILLNAWISDQDEVDYYLNEFDLIVLKSKAISS